MPNHTSKPTHEFAALFWDPPCFFVGQKLAKQSSLPILQGQLLSASSLFPLGIFILGAAGAIPCGKRANGSTFHASTAGFPGCADKHPVRRKISSPHLVLREIS